MRIEAVFGGILALFVIGVAIYAILSRGGGNQGPIPPGSGYETPGPVSDSDIDRQVCSCFSQGFDLAGSDVGVMSAQYRTGVEVCRNQVGEKGGCAFTAGWNARMSSRPFEASCRAWLNRDEAC